MAINLDERYPGRANGKTLSYPQGSFKNRTSPTSKDGTYLEADWANDLLAFFQSLIKKAGFTANGQVDTAQASQYFDALQAVQNQVVQGLVATETEVHEGIDNTKLITPANLPFRVASENNTGMIAVATKEMAEDGTDNERTSTPLRVFQAIRSAAALATESLRGVLRVATQAEVTAGTLDDVAVTPKKLRNGFGASLSGNGYITLPSWLGGLTIQWGTIAQASLPLGLTAKAFSFPIAFNSNVYAISSTASTGSFKCYASAASSTLTFVNINMVNADAAPVSLGAFVIAIGR